MIPPYWEQAKKTLAKADPVMKGIIHSYRGEVLTSRGDAFHTLARSVVGQQISVKAADAVWTRLIAGIQDSGLREGISLRSEEGLRACGLSQSKVLYLKSLANFFICGDIQENHWDNMSDEEVIGHLTQIKGIGRWSAEMFLIFHLLRPDVLPVDDIGLQKAIKRHYALENNKKIIIHHAQQWRPYRSVATWYLWRSLDPVPVAY